MNAIFPFRTLLPTEHHACFVGSGECYIPARYATDDGAGTEVFLCPLHREEFAATEKLFASLSPHKIEQLEAAVEEAHRQQKGQS